MKTTANICPFTVYCTHLMVSVAKTVCKPIIQKSQKFD